MLIPEAVLDSSEHLERKVSKLVKELVEPLEIVSSVLREMDVLGIDLGSPSASWSRTPFDTGHARNTSKVVGHHITVVSGTKICGQG